MGQSQKHVLDAGLLLVGCSADQVVLFLGADGRDEHADDGQEGDDYGKGQPAAWPFFMLAGSLESEVGYQGNDDDGQTVPADRPREVTQGGIDPTLTAVFT